MGSVRIQLFLILLLLQVFGLCHASVQSKSCGICVDYTILSVPVLL